MYNAETFFKNTFAIFTECNCPDQESNHTSGSGSAYRYGEYKGKQGVFRTSNHWGGYVATCSWFLNRINTEYLNTCDQVSATGFCAFEDFKTNGSFLISSVVVCDIAADLYFGLNELTVKFVGIDATARVRFGQFDVFTDWFTRKDGMNEAVITEIANCFGFEKVYFA